MVCWWILYIISVIFHQKVSECVFKQQHYAVNVNLNSYSFCFFYILILVGISIFRHNRYNVFSFRRLDVQTPLFVIFLAGTPWVITTDSDHVKVCENLLLEFIPGCIPPVQFSP